MVTANNFLRAVLIALFLLSTTVWALWDPNKDPNLIMNMDFETYTQDVNTTDSVSGLVGDVVQLTADGNSHPFKNDSNSLPGFGWSLDLRSPVDVAGGDDGACRIDISQELHGNATVFDEAFDLDALFEQGVPISTPVRTFSAWVGHHEGDGTVIGRRELGNQYYWWVAMRNHKVAMDAKHGGTIVLRVETALTTQELGIVNNEWHHLIGVFNRRNYDHNDGSYDAKIYVDGAPADVLYNGHDPCQLFVDDPCVIIGGAHDFDDYDGIFDEIRVYTRDLNDTEASLLYQWTPSNKGPWALLPFPNYRKVSTLTDIGWQYRAGATSQRFLFDTEPNLGSPDVNVVLSGVAKSMTNNEINGTEPSLAHGTTYYWAIDTNEGGGYDTGTIWKFTTDFGYASNEVPANYAKGVPFGLLDLQWTAPIDVCSFDVYFSDDFDDVNDMNIPNARIRDDITDTNTVVVLDPCSVPKGTMEYWRVVSNFIGASVPGPVWKFRVASSEIVVNTSNADTDYDGKTYTARTMTFVDANKTIDGNLGTDGVVIFEVNDFDISSAYDVVVIPVYRGSETDANKYGKPMAIHVDGDFYFDGRMYISGEIVDKAPVGDYWPYASCGGYAGCRTNINNRTPWLYFAARIDPCNVWDMSDPRGFYIQTAAGYAALGPGVGFEGPLSTGGGGGYGGIGGESGRGWMHGQYDGGDVYGDEEVPVPFGGSSGSFSKHAPGGSGGGGLEIAAKGNVTFGPDAELYADGGASLFAPDYGSGGGSGGSVRIIADGNFVNQGVITANGGRGTNTYNKANNAGGGGGGGRIAIWYGGTDLPALGTITANGGAEGIWTTEGTGNASPGVKGTIFVSARGPNDLAKKASAPTPRDGDDIVYVPGGGPNTIDLKWYAGYGGTTAQVYFGTVDPPVATLGSPTDANRGEHSITSPLLTAGNTYYWKVKTDGTVDSDIWSFTVVNWQCVRGGVVAPVDPTKIKPEWDTFPHCDCIVTFEDFAHFALHWMKRDNMGYGGEGQGIQTIMKEWLTPRGRI